MFAIFVNFIAEALPSALLFYGLLWRFRGPGSVSWGAHIIAIGAVCFAVAVIRLGSAGLFGGKFALENSMLWALFIPGALSLAAVAIHKVIVNREPLVPNTRPPMPTPPVTEPIASQRVGTDQPKSAPAPVQVAPRPATPAAVFVVIGAAIGGGVVLVLVGLVWLAVMEIPGQGNGAGERSATTSPRREIVDPFKAPPMQRGFGREADPAWRALRAEWEGRNQAWLQVPGAREALHQAILVEDAEGTATSYEELLAKAVSRAQRGLYEKQRRTRAGG